MILNRKSIANSVGALFRALKFFTKHKGSPFVSQQDYIERHRACFGCEHYVVASQQCRLCTCLISLKAKLRTEKCPARPSRWNTPRE